MKLIFRTKNNRYVEVRIWKYEYRKWKMEKQKTEAILDKIIRRRKIRSMKMEIFGPELTELEMGFSEYNLFLIQSSKPNIQILNIGF